MQQQVDQLSALPSIAIGALSTAIMAWGAIRLLAPLGFLDHPGGRKLHGAPVPVVGGLALGAALLLGQLLDWVRLPLRPEHWVAIALMALVGVLDDRLDLRARWKALAGLGVALFLALPAAFRLVSQPQALEVFGWPLPHHVAYYALILTLYYWAIPQIFNLIDGANGLAMGYALILLALLGWAGFPELFLLGALAALLLFNFPKARLFLGDGGALPLGLLLAILAKRDLALVSQAELFWLFAYPALDTSMVILQRVLRRQSPGQGDRSHLHHRLVDQIPFARAWAVPWIWLHVFLCGLGILPGVPTWIPVAGFLSLLGQSLGLALLDRQQPQKVHLSEHHVRESGLHVDSSKIGIQA